MTALAASAILLGLTPRVLVAQDGGKGEAKEAVRAAAGTVVAVTPESRTVVLESTLGGKPWVLGIEVPEGLSIAAGGKTKKLEDLKTGDRVRLRWIREKDRLVAESIAVIGAKAP
jgi:hypothetical protein